MKEPISVLALAILLDLGLGDPELRFHPVRLMGDLIKGAERSLRMLPVSSFIQGLILACSIPLGLLAMTHLLLKAAWGASPVLGVICSSLILYSTIGLRSLGDEAASVKRALEAKDLARARKRLSRIVGRETKELDVNEISRAAVETVAENLVDAVIAPLFYWAIGGSSLAVFYRAVNTLDAMVGYRNHRYERFGKASARLDDLMNLVPARLSVLFVAIFSPFMGGPSPATVLKAAFKEGKGHESPNAGPPEAAFSKVLGVRLGGPTRYTHGTSLRPFMNQDGQVPDPESIRQAVVLLHLASLSFSCFIAALGSALKLLL